MMEDSPVKELLGRATKAAGPMDREKSWGIELSESLGLAEQALVRAAERRTAEERDSARVVALVAKAEYLRHAEHERKQELRREALVLARKLRDHGMIADLLVHITVMDLSRDLDRAQNLEEAANEYQKAGDERGEGMALLWRAGEFLDAGDVAEARKMYRHAGNLLRRGGDYAGAAMCDAALELVAQ